jgi:hypothetical protein
MVKFLTQISEESFMPTSNLITKLYRKVKKEMGPLEAKDLISDIVSVAISDLDEKQIPFSDKELTQAIESRASDFLEVLNKKSA